MSLLTTSILHPSTSDPGRNVQFILKYPVDVFFDMITSCISYVSICQIVKLYDYVTMNIVIEFDYHVTDMRYHFNILLLTLISYIYFVISRKHCNCTI